MSHIAGTGLEAWVWRPGLGDGRIPGDDVLAAIRRAGLPRPAEELARALAASPPAAKLPGLVLAVRERPSPFLVFAGRPDEAGRARLQALAHRLDGAGRRLRIFSWSDAEACAGRLAGALVGRFGREAVESAAIAAVPRGGLAAAALLAYALGLPAGRVGSLGRGPDPAPAATPASGRAPAAKAAPGLLILADDCALTGVRLREALARCSAPRIAVATLVSHPELRRAVERSEPRVEACLAGTDLRDFGPELLGDGEQEWRRWWAGRAPQGYHSALLDLVAFPWSEPEVRLWNPVTEAVEAHWWLAPPSLCLRNRAAPAHLDVQVADERPGIERLGPAVVPVAREGRTVLVDAERRAGVTLSGTAQELWEAWMSGGPEAAAAEVAARYEEPLARVRADLDGLLQGLAARGLLAGDEAGALA